MKFTVVLLALLPLALSASIDEKRFIEQLLGGYDGMSHFFFRFLFLFSFSFLPVLPVLVLEHIFLLLLVDFILALVIVMVVLVTDLVVFYSSP